MPSLIAQCISRYAARLHAAIGSGHQVASPLGAWLLLALAAPASSGSDRTALTDVLGCDPDTASRLAGSLLRTPHPAIASAVAFWTAPPADRDERLERWQDQLPGPVSRGPLPDQAGLDAWAREHTFGLIDQFPVRRSPDLLLVLATVLATRVSWLTPFTTVPAGRLGDGSPWAARLDHVLATPRPSRGHDQFVAVTTEAGDVAVHCAAATGGLAVFSVAAAPEVPALTVLAAAHRVACEQAAGGTVPRRSPAELPLGEAPLWLVREVSSSGPACTAVLPAWSARSEHDLSAAGLGFAAAKQALLPGPEPWRGVQSVVARYSRTGFEAAAVTSVAVAAAMRRPALRRVAELRFGHPYAVVAVAVSTPPGQPGPWAGLPVFSAWVSEPENAGAENPGPGLPR
jgi:hypothetical protein